MALQGLYKGKVNNFYIVTDFGLKTRLNKVSSGQKLYGKIVYNIRHCAYA